MTNTTVPNVQSLLELDRVAKSTRTADQPI